MALLFLTVVEALRLQLGLGEAKAWLWLLIDFASFLPFVAAFVTAFVVLWRAPQRLGVVILAVLLAGSALWLGLELGKGAGLQRQGLQFLPPLLLPLTAFLVPWFTHRLIRKRAWDTPLRFAVLLLLAAMAAGFANARYLVGLYASVHVALWFLELLLLALGIRFLLAHWRLFAFAPSSQGVKMPAALLSLAAAVVVSLCFLPLELDLDEATRSRYGRLGLRSAQIQRWRGQVVELDGQYDRALINSFEAWSDRSAAAQSRLPADRNWNLIWISIDTLRADRMGAVANKNRNSESLTPALDRFAKEGAVFDCAYSQYPSTHLSTASMFSGRYPKATTLFRQLTGSVLPDDDPDLALTALLKQQGFATSASVAFTDEWMGHPTFAKSLADFDRVNFARPGAPELDAKHFVESAKSSLLQMANQRSFLWFHIFEPHAPYDPHPGLTKGDDAIARYDGEVAYADQQVGRLLETLQQQGVFENTIVVLSSDHGESLGEHGLRFHGSSLRQEQVRVPLALYYPGIKPQRRSELVGNVDIYATLVDLLALDGAPKTQSRSLLPLVSGSAEDRAAWPNLAYMELPDDVKELSAASANVAALVEGKWKLIRHLSGGYSELFDLELDPGENSDRSADHPKIKEGLENRLYTMAKWTKEFGRKSSFEDQKKARLRELRDRLKASDPLARLAALREAKIEDPDAFIDSALAFARDGKEFPEIRLEALELLSASKSNTASAARASARKSLFEARDPAMQAAALATIPLGEKVSSSLVGRSASSFAIDQCTLLAFASDDLNDEFYDVWRLQETANGSLELVRRAALAELLRSDYSDAAVDSRRIDQYSWSEQEKTLIAEHLLKRNPNVAYVVFERWVRDRYLEPSLRKLILTKSSTFPKEPQRELARHLLSGWDPSFHQLALMVLTDRFDAETVRALARCREIEDEVEGAQKKENWLGMMTALQVLLDSLPADSGQLRVQLALLRAANAAGRPGPAAAVRASFAKWVPKISARWRLNSENWLKDALIAELWEVTQSQVIPLSEDSEIKILAIDLAECARRIVSPGQDLKLKIALSNRSRFALPSGPFARGGRVRVLWRRNSGGDILYGDERAISPGLVPEEDGWQWITVSAPKEPGDWRGRVIIHQWGGPRFHVAETDSSLFDIKVIDPLSIPAEIDFNAAEMAQHFEPGEGVVFWGLEAPGKACRSLIKSYRGSFLTPPFLFDGASKVLSLDLAWLSASSDAMHLFVRFVPMDGNSPPLKQKSFAVLRDGVRRQMTLPLGRPQGSYRLEIIVGGRPGILELWKFAIGG